MGLGAFLMVVGMVGAALLTGVMVRALSVRQRIRGMGLWLAAMIFMGAVAALASASKPVIEPLLLQYALFLALPFCVGFIVLAVVLRPARRS